MPTARDRRPGGGDSQVQLILSRDLAREVIKKLKLGALAEFDPVLGPPSVVRRLLALAGSSRISGDDARGAGVQELLRAALAIQVEKSRVIAISFDSYDPELAAQVANAVADAYLLFQQAAKQTRPARRQLARRRDRSAAGKRRPGGSQGRALPRTSNLFIGNNNTTLSNQQLGDFNAQLAAARAQKADAAAKATLIRGALKAGYAHRVFRDRQFGADAPLVGAAGAAARSTRRAVLDIA